MPRYLIVDNPNSGFAQLNNVGVVESSSKVEAIEKYTGKTKDNLLPQYKFSHYSAFNLDNIEDGWKYYT